MEDLLKDSKSRAVGVHFKSMGRLIMMMLLKPRRFVSLLCLVIVSSALLEGCASSQQTRYLTADPEYATTVLQVGDEVKITRKDGSIVSLTLTAINDTELIGKDERVPLSDIAEIAAYVPGGSRDLSDGTYEAIGWIGAILIWGAIL